MKIPFLILCLVMLVFTRCSTSKIPPIDQQTGKFPTKKTLKATEIIVDKTISFNDYNQFLYIYINKYSDVAMEYENYLLGTFREIGGFNTYYTENALERFVIQNNLADKVTNVYDSASLANLQKEVGPFLICEITILKEFSFSYIFELKIIVPAHREVVLDIYHEPFIWSSFNKELFNPVFNYYIDWLVRSMHYQIPGG